MHMENWLLNKVKTCIVLRAILLEIQTFALPRVIAIYRVADCFPCMPASRKTAVGTQTRIHARASHGGHAPCNTQLRYILRYVTK